VPDSLISDRVGHLVVSGGVGDAILQTFDPSGQLLVSRDYGSTNKQSFDVTAAASDGTLWGVGYVGPGSTVDFGVGSIPPPAGVLVHLDATGALLQQRVFPVTGEGSNVAAPASVVTLSSRLLKIRRVGDLAIASSRS
jgi:hypothetical protein